MPRGVGPYEYLENPVVDKPLEQIYEDMDAFSAEIFKDEPDLYDIIECTILLPPLYYEGVFTKGIFYSQGVDILLHQIPKLSQYFFSIANSNWVSYAWSQSADALFTGYKNPQRENWFRAHYPDRADKILIPLQDADFMDEYNFGVTPTPRDTDVLCVSRLNKIKNLSMIAQALKVYRELYPRNPIKMTLICAEEFDMNLEGLSDEAKDVFRELESILIHPTDYIEFVPFVPPHDMVQFYSRAKVLVLGSLIEGKNASINEALSCDTPVICFQEHNQYIRGESPAFPEGAGLYARFNPDSLAHTIHEVLQNQQKFKPRLQYIRENGREKFVNRCIDSFPYFENTLPEYRRGEHLWNRWLDLAVQQACQVSWHQFMYHRRPHYLEEFPEYYGTCGLKNIKNLFQNHLSRFE